MMLKPRLLMLYVSGFLVLVSVLVSACSDVNPSQEAQTVQLPVVTNTDNSQNAYPVEEGGYPAPGTPQGETDLPPVPAEAAFFAPPSEGIPTFAGKLAFQTERFGALQVAILDGATGEISQLNSEVSQSFEPDWSPDCTAVVYTTGPVSGEDFEVNIKALAGEARPLVTSSDTYDWAAAWSPIGDVIAYQNNRDALINICFTNLAGEDLGCMERGSFSNAMPAWSPDGTQLAFGSNREGNWELYVTDYPAFTSLTRLTTNNDIDFHPQFSPDGQTILFTSKRLGIYDLYLIKADGEGERPLTSDPADERDPVWVGDSQIAYTANIQDDWELYLVNADGSNVQRLTYARGADQWPAWCASK